MCKTEKKARNYTYFYCKTKISNRRQENCICKNELTRDFRGQNETKYNTISFLVQFGLTYEKTTENKSKELIKKISLKTRNYFFAVKKFYYSQMQREMEVVNQKDKRNKPII